MSTVEDWLDSAMAAERQWGDCAEEDCESDRIALLLRDPPIWLTKRGARLPLADMDDEHLRNTRALVARATGWDDRGIALEILDAEIRRRGRQP